MGARRELTERFLALATHYSFEPCFARPGEGHDKGAVESRGKAIRLRHLSPIPQGDSLDQLSSWLQGEIERVDSTSKNDKGESVGERFAQECELLMELPEPFEARTMIDVSVSSSARVRLLGSTYSVPCHWAGLRVLAWVGTKDIRVASQGEKIILPRLEPKSCHIQYRHYLPQLARKPQAVRQVAPALVEELGAPFDAFWRLLLGRLEPLDASRAFAKVIRCIVEHDEPSVAQAINRAIESGKLDLLCLGAVFHKPRKESAVPCSLAGFEVESARASDFDELLKGEES